jgi:type I restriction enzyme, S subunit
MQYPKYGHYKPTDVTWLPLIPNSWNIRRLRFEIQSNPVKSEVNLWDKSDKPLEDVYTGYTYFRNNDVVIAKITPCFENGKGALMGGLTNGVGFGTTEFHVMRANSTTSER